MGKVRTLRHSWEEGVMLAGAGARGAEAASVHKGDLSEETRKLCSVWQCFLKFEMILKYIKNKRMKKSGKKKIEEWQRKAALPTPLLEPEPRPPLPSHLLPSAPRPANPFSSCPRVTLWPSPCFGSGASAASLRSSRGDPRVAQANKGSGSSASGSLPKAPRAGGEAALQEARAAVWPVWSRSPFLPSPCRY